MTRDKLRAMFDGDPRPEIKRVALRQLAEGGPAAVSVNAIGRDLGVSGPALYRYFAGRDALLQSLILDAYADLKDATAAAVAARRTTRTRVLAYADAYRTWAVTQPHRYRLLFREPLPGYDANSGPLVAAAQGAMEVVLDALRDAAAPSVSNDPDHLRDWLRERGADPGLAPRARVGIRIWTRLHGLVSLEIEGCFASMGVDPEHLYRDEVDVRALP